MAIAVKKNVITKNPVRVAATHRRSSGVVVTNSEGRQILDAQAQKYLKMSGAEFARKYRAGEIPDPDRSEVLRVAMLLPYVDHA